MLRQFWFFLRDFREFALLVTAVSVSTFLVGMYWIYFEPEVIKRSWRGALIPYATWIAPVFWILSLLYFFSKYRSAKNSEKNPDTGTD
jgi:hypothetical protein